MRDPLCFAFAALLLMTACASPESTLGEARDLLERVRPDAQLQDVRVVVWNSAADAEAATADAKEYLSLPYVQRVLLAHAQDFERLGMKRAFEVLAQRRLATDAPDIPAFVVPTAGSVVARPAAATNLDVMTHELSHIASWQQGYWDAPAPFLWLDAERVGDPNWIDLDAFIAGWAIEEGCAELTSAIAMSLLEPETERASFVQRHIDWAGDALTKSILGPLVVRTQQFAYGNGLRFVAARGGDATKDLESRIRDAWQTFRGTSLEVLKPDRSSTPSRLAAALRRDLPTLDPRPVAATRWGAFLMFEVLSEAQGYEVAEFLPLVDAFRDDLWLTFDGGRQLWITEWDSIESAAEFAQRIAGVTTAASVSREARRTLVSWNAPAEVAGWWSRTDE